MSFPPLRYQALLFFLSPFLGLRVLWQAWKVRSARFLRQRLGFGYRKQDEQTVWIHCASVGEVTAAIPLIKRLGVELPHQPLIVSTTTPTGAETVFRQNWPNVQHQYLPVDFKISIRCLLYTSPSPRDRG